MISDTRLPPTFRAFISSGRREPGDEVTRVASVEELYSCIKHVESSLGTGLGLFR